MQKRLLLAQMSVTLWYVRCGKYTFGRESNTAYAETINSVHVAKSHQFTPTIKVAPM